MKQHLFIALLFAFISPVNSYGEKADSHEFDPAFTHVVYFWLKNPDSAADRSKFEAAVKQFMQDSKYAKTRFVGVAMIRHLLLIQLDRPSATMRLPFQERCTAYAN